MRKVRDDLFAEKVSGYKLGTRISLASKYRLPTSVLSRNVLLPSWLVSKKSGGCGKRLKIRRVTSNNPTMIIGMRININRNQNSLFFFTGDFLLTMNGYSLTVFIQDVKWKQGITLNRKFLLSPVSAVCRSCQREIDFLCRMVRINLTFCKSILIFSPDCG